MCSHQSRTGNVSDWVSENTIITVPVTCRRAYGYWGDSCDILIIRLQCVNQQDLKKMCITRAIFHICGFQWSSFGEWINREMPFKDWNLVIIVNKHLGSGCCKQTHIVPSVSADPDHLRTFQVSFCLDAKTQLLF